VRTRRSSRYRRARRPRKPGVLDRLLALAKLVMLLSSASAALKLVHQTPARTPGQLAVASPRAAAFRTVCEAASTLVPALAPLVCSGPGLRQPPVAGQKGQHRVYQPPPRRGWTVQKEPRQPWVAEPW